ncbi:MAG: hypothetical protein ACUVQY_03250 [Thermoproteota archaeon]
MARDSKLTADLYLRKLGNFCSTYKTSPESILKMSEEGLQNFLMDCVMEMERKGYAGSYIETVIKVVCSWLSHNRVEIKGAEDTPSLKDERVPTKEELKRIFSSGDRKTRVACALVAHSGLRIEVVGNHTEDDRLRVKDLPELVIYHHSKEERSGRK